MKGARRGAHRSPAASLSKVPERKANDESIIAESARALFRPLLLGASAIMRRTAHHWIINSYNSKNSSNVMFMNSIIVSKNLKTFVRSIQWKKELIKHE